MRAFWRWTLRAVVVFLALLVVGATYEAVAAALAKRSNAPPGEMVDVGGRQLHLLCKGQGPGPTVVVEQGAAELSVYWWSTQDRIASFARVCTYDRAGYGWSDPAPRPRSIEDRVVDLDAVLTRGGVPGPYVLVGHSYGGPMVDLYVREHPEQVAGAVFVDSPDLPLMFGPGYRQVIPRWHLPLLRTLDTLRRFGVLRLASTLNPDWTVAPPGLSRDARRAVAGVRDAELYDAVFDDMASIIEGREPASPRPGALGAKPVAVLIAGQPLPEAVRPIMVGADEGHRRNAALSSNSLTITVPQSGHMMNLDAPEPVIDAIRRVHAAARDGTPLRPGPSRPTPP